MKRLALISLLWLLGVSVAFAQNYVKPCIPSGESCVPVTSGAPFPVIQSGGSFLNIQGAATTAVKTSAGTLVGIVVNNAITSSTITIYDSLAASGTKIGTITNPGTLLNNQYMLVYGLQFATGLTIVTSGADDLTVIYK